MNSYIAFNNKDEQNSDTHHYHSKKSQMQQSVYLRVCFYQVLEDSKLIYIRVVVAWVSGMKWIECKGVGGNFLGDSNVIYCDRVMSYTDCKVYTFGKTQ